ncbi:MAG: hypothetical protein K2J08_02890 [Ruminococcus sp.]|nr:hypothetical protein [Ruminococcus sp.]
MLLNEIESLNVKFSDISERLSEAKGIVDEAKNSIDTNAKHDIKKMDAPQVDMSDVKKEAEKAKTPVHEVKKPETKKSEPVASQPKSVTNQQKPVNNPVKPNNMPKPANNINRNTMPNTANPVVPPRPVAPPRPVQPKQQPKKPLFDMAGMDELLKSVEADEAKNS